MYVLLGRVGGGGVGNPDISQTSDSLILGTSKVFLARRK